MPKNAADQNLETQGMKPEREENTGDSHSMKATVQASMTDPMYRMVVDKMDQGLAVHEAILDHDGKMIDYRFLEVNPSFEQLTGLRKEDVIGKTVLELLPQTEAYWFERFGDVVTTGEPCDIEDFSRELNRHYQVSAFRNAPGQFTVIISDITEHKRKEITRDIRYQIANTFAATSDLGKLFEATRTQLNRLFDTTNFVYAEYHPGKKMFTAPYEYDVRDIIPEWDANRTLSDQVVQTGTSLLLNQAEIQQLLSDGVIDQVGAIPKVWLGVPIHVRNRVHGLLMTQSYKTNDAFSHSTVDLLESIAVQWGQYLHRLDAEETLKARESFFQLVTDQMADNITVLDLQMRITYCSPSIEKIRGFTTEEVVSQTIQDILTPESYQKLMSIFGEEMALEVSGTGDPDRHITLELEEYHKDGSVIWVESTMSFLRKDNGEATGILVISRDITERKRINQELVTALQRAEESDRLKSAFLANMSHEIRTPMNGILGFTDLLRTPEMPYAEQMRLLDIVEQSGHRLFNLINDLIDISRIESGQMPVYPEEVALKGLFDELHQFFSHDAHKKGLQLEFLPDSASDTPLITIDKTKLHSIMSNLIKNAIKFTEQGQITFGYQFTRHDVSMFVEDTGIGIPADKTRMIFDRFGQADLSFQRGYEGAGLGLSISKAYVEMLGGTIHVASTVGKGSKFMVTIPLQTGKRATEATDDLQQVCHDTDGNSAPPLHILVAEDDEVTREYLSIILKTHARQIDYVESGLDAVAYIKSHPTCNLVLMDIKLYGIDGLEATRRIRTFNSNVIIVAQTAYALSGDRERAIESGCNDYITKPMNKEVLIRLIKKYITN